MSERHGICTSVENIIDYIENNVEESEFKDRMLHRLAFVKDQQSGVAPKFYKGKLISNWYTCGNCGFIVGEPMWKYCPNCGYFVKR